jgi:hypothetical protein
VYGARSLAQRCCGSKRNAKFFANVRARPGEIQERYAQEKSIYHGLVLVLHIPVFTYIPLDTAARLGVSLLGRGGINRFTEFVFPMFAKIDLR